MPAYQSTARNVQGTVVDVIADICPFLSWVATRNGRKRGKMRKKGDLQDLVAANYVIWWTEYVELNKPNYTHHGGFIG